MCIVLRLPATQPAIRAANDVRSLSRERGLKEREQQLAVRTFCRTEREHSVAVAVMDARRFMRSCSRELIAPRDGAA